MADNRTESPLRTLGRRLALGVDRVVGLPGRALVALANVGQRAANGAAGWIAREPEVVLIFSFTLAAWMLFITIAKFP